jgi:hypothetical protein
MTEPATEQKHREELTRLLQQLQSLKDELEKYRKLLPPDELDRLTSKEKR